MQQNIMSLIAYYLLTIDTIDKHHNVFSII